MRRFFSAIGRFFMCCSRYLWITGVLYIVLGLVLLWIWCGPLDAFTDFCNNLANGILETNGNMFNMGWGMAVLDWAGHLTGSLFGTLFLALPCLLLAVVMFVLQFALAIIWLVISLILAFLVVIIYFIVAILLTYVIAPAAGVGAIIWHVMLYRDKAYETGVESSSFALNLIMCVAALVIFYVFAYTPM